jgi:hypothetical protein
MNLQTEALRFQSYDTKRLHKIKFFTLGQRSATRYGLRIEKVSHLILRPCFPVRMNTRHCADEADLATPGSEAEAALADLVEVPGVVAGSSISSPAYPAAVGRVGDV